MFFIRFIQSPAGRALRVIAGLLLLLYWTLALGLAGIVAMMAGVMSLVTGVAGVPHPRGAP
jgi:hypothetical protein